MLWMNNIIHKFTLLGVLVVDCCAETLSVARKCMLLSQHRRFVCCELDLECVASNFPQLALVFSQHVLNKKFDSTGNDDVQQALFAFFEAIEEPNLKRCMDVWEAPVDFSITQTFLLHILYCRLTNHMEFSLNDKAKNIPANI